MRFVATFTLAIFSLWLLAQPAENFVESLDMIARLLEVIFESFSQLGIGRLFRHLRERLYQLSLGVVKIAQFFDPEGSQ